MFANFATALPAGATMTFLILFGMQSLIAMQPGAAVVATDNRIPTWLYEHRNEDTIIDDFDLDDIPETVPAPPLEPGADNTYDGPLIYVPPGTPTPRVQNNELTGLGFNDGPLVAVVRVQPTYPSSMSARGISGHVTVIFDVLTDGTVTNIAVLESSHKGFERAAIQAASRFRFKARVVDGVPQPSTGIRYRFAFEMDH